MKGIVCDYEKSLCENFPVLEKVALREKELSHSGIWHLKLGFRMLEGWLLSLNRSKMSKSLFLIGRLRKSRCFFYGNAREKVFASQLALKGLVFRNLIISWKGKEFKFHRIVKRKKLWSQRMSEWWQFIVLPFLLLSFFLLAL